MINLDVIRDERLKICSLCEMRTHDWKCSKNGNSVIIDSKNLDKTCPEDKWEKSYFPSSKEDSFLLSSMNLLNKQGEVSREGVQAIQKCEGGAFPANLKTSLTLKPNKRLLNSKTSVDKILFCAEQLPPGGWPQDFEKWANTQQAFRLLTGKRASEIINEIYPKERFNGRGVVFCGGGLKYFPSIYVNVRMLRLLGCELPIEVFYLGVNEMDDSMIKLMENIPNVKCINGRDLESKYPIRIHAGWEAKVYAIMNSSFEEVLMLDADNTPLDNPIHLFEEYEFKRTGAILWPDYSCWVHDRNMWNILGIEPRDELQVESGQTLINKRMCWKELNLAKHYCDYSDYYFKLFYGDKEAFHFGWRYFGSEYGIPPSPDWINNCVILQKNFDGSWLFSHRAQAKFKLDKTHPHAWDIPYEQDTLELLDELNRLWNGAIWVNKTPSEQEISLINILINKKYRYVRVGMDERPIELLLNNVIGEGSAKLEKNWYIFIENNVVKMAIHGDNGLTAILTNVGDKWIGKWIDFEKCDLEIIPI